MTATKSSKAGSRTRSSGELHNQRIMAGLAKKKAAKKRTLGERLVGAIFEGDGSARGRKPQPKVIKWSNSKADILLITKIAKRAASMLEAPGMDLQMDIEATHCNGCPLDLEKLLAADDFNFAHDIYGIRRYLNRSTGELQNCFVPRFAKTEQEPVTY